ncbi:S-adenosyl-L-methionine-dependent methyltransferase [Schizopora paradoxa]|uniref:S-adenosyl-L-methionine-dependent methyltransferase n=1 Tax=Schizopora paradoxa TaxID=27342 RepID=A0A0H2S1G2_9AGAM|nr:S-adenosyl-L-methionine-dependent methyltransferase [Schizopora paradoxa]
MPANNLNGNLSDDSPDSDGESMSSLSSEELARHFQTRYGRQFHSYGMVPYPLPADPAEMQRLDRMHDAVKHFFGGRNYCERVGQLLHEPLDARMRIADLGTGSGKWVDEMAVEFPNFKFYGVDIAPTATQEPEENVQYEINPLQATGFDRGYFHFVHMRQTSLGITDYVPVVREIARILRPRGYFYSAEWLRRVFMADGSNVEQQAPLAVRFFRIIDRLMQSRHVPSDPEGQLLVAVLLQSQQFEVVHMEHRQILGEQGAVGLHFRNAFKEYADAFKYLLLDSGCSEGNAEQLITGFKHDIDVVPGLTVVYTTVLARKLL